MQLRTVFAPLGRGSIIRVIGPPVDNMTKTGCRILMFALVVGSLGCQEESIRVHRIPKPPRISQRTVAVVIPRDDATWFLKISGPAEDVAVDEASFRQFAESVTFGKDSAIDWKSPDTWKVQAAGQFETAVFRTSRQVKVSVSQLGAGQDLLMNVNRWREQIGLPRVGAAELPKMTKPITLGGVTATWVDLSNADANDA